MSSTLTREELTRRAAIDGRVAFAAAAFLVLAGLVALIDRVGAPEGLVRLMGPIFVLAALATIGVLMRSVRVSGFYAAGRAVPAPYVGFAAVAVCAGVTLPFVSPNGQTLGAAASACGGIGFATAVVVVGPYLRKTGAFSAVDALATRFPNAALRMGLALLVAIVGALIGLAGLDFAVRPLVEALGASRNLVSAILAFVLVLVAAPGGMGGIVWAASGAAAVLLGAFTLPAALLAVRGDMPLPLPLPGLGDPVAWDGALQQILTWQEGGLAVGGPLTALGAGVAVVSVVSLLIESTAARDARAAVRAGGLTLAWSALVGLFVAIAVLWGAAVFSRVVVGRSPDRLPDAVYAASATGLVDICGRSVRGPAEARTACATRAVPGGPLSSADVRPRSPLFLASLTAVSGAGAAGAGLFAAGMLAVGLSLAAVGFFLCATALGHDLLYRMSGRETQSSRRLAITRALLVAIVAFGAAATGARTYDPRLLIGFAGTLAAAGVLPLLLLSLHRWATDRHGFIAFAVGVACAIVLLWWQPFALDTLLRTAFLAATAGTVAGLLTSALFAADRLKARAFVDAVLHGDGDVFGPDKGA